MTRTTLITTIMSQARTPNLKDFGAVLHKVGYQQSQNSDMYQGQKKIGKHGHDMKRKYGKS